MKLKRFFLGGAVVVLLTAVLLIVWGEGNVPGPHFHGQLREVLPSAPVGWRMVEKPIADTPELQAAVGEILNFDDGIFVDYVGDGRRLSVYLAYWTPGKMNYREIASHTPDVCWVLNGWVKDSAGQVNPSSGAGPALQPGESRSFIANGQKEYVWFWHVIGGKVKSYETGTIPPWYSAISDMWERGLNQREEQFFIRISSSEPLERYKDMPFFRKMLDALPLHAAGASL